MLVTILRMRISQWLVAFFILAHASAKADEIELSGMYQGKNIYVQNPSVSGNQDFCTEEVFVNGTKKMSKIQSSAFEIDLSFLSINDSVHIRITFKEDCAPKVLNASALRPSTTFYFKTFVVKEDQVQWTTTGEKAQYIYYLEQWKNNNWNVVKSLNAKGAGAYQLPVAHEAKANRYRVRVQDQDTHKIYYSESTDYVLAASAPPITFYPKSVTNKITLSRSAAYQVLNPKGELIKKGKGSEIPLADLKTGVYYLSINDQKQKFFKK